MAVRIDGTWGLALGGRIEIKTLGAGRALTHYAEVVDGGVGDADGKKNGVIIYNGRANMSQYVQIDNNRRYGDDDIFWHVKQNAQRNVASKTKSAVFKLDKRDGLVPGSWLIFLNTQGKEIFRAQDNGKADLDTTGNGKFSHLLGKNFSGSVLVRRPDGTQNRIAINNLGVPGQQSIRPWGQITEFQNQWNQKLKLISDFERKNRIGAGDPSSQTNQQYRANIGQNMTRDFNVSGWDRGSLTGQVYDAIKWIKANASKANSTWLTPNQLNEWSGGNRAGTLHGLRGGKAIFNWIAATAPASVKKPTGLLNVSDVRSNFIAFMNATHTVSTKTAASMFYQQGIGAVSYFNTQQLSNVVSDYQLVIANYKATLETIAHVNVNQSALVKNLKTGVPFVNGNSFFNLKTLIDFMNKRLSSSLNHLANNVKTLVADVKKADSYSEALFARERIKGVLQIFAACAGVVGSGILAGASLGRAIEGGTAAIGNYFSAAGSTINSLFNNLTVAATHANITMQNLPNTDYAGVSTSGAMSSALGGLKGQAADVRASLVSIQTELAKAEFEIGKRMNNRDFNGPNDAGFEDISLTKKPDAPDYNWNSENRGYFWKYIDGDGWHRYRVHRWLTG